MRVWARRAAVPLLLAACCQAIGAMGATTGYVGTR